MKIKSNQDLSIKIMDNLIRTKDLLANLNILIAKMKNPYLLTYILEKIDTISSNEVENIYTTVDEAANDFIEKNQVSPYAQYREALKLAHNRLLISNIITSNDIQKINNCVRGRKIGFRKTPIKIVESKNKETIHYGADAQNIPKLITNLTKLINNDDWYLDPVIKALLIHHQFEYIHPFTDGNGRTGRIIFAILLTKYKVLEVPASVFSYSIVKNKKKYYEALKVGDNGDYHKYLEIMLDIFNDSLKISIDFAIDLDDKYLKIENFIDEKFSNQKFLELLPHCFIGVKVSMKFLEKKSKLNNKTITKYLRILEDLKIMKQEVKGKRRPYKNLIIESLIGKYLNI